MQHCETWCSTCGEQPQHESKREWWPTALGVHVNFNERDALVYGWGHFRINYQYMPIWGGVELQSTFAFQSQITNFSNFRDIPVKP
jgi:hypothetical protein